MSHLGFIAAVAAAYTLFIGVLYRRPGRVNEIFDQYRRTGSLRVTITLWFGVMAVTFLFVQWLRLPFFRYVLEKIASAAALTSSGLDLVHTAGLVVVVLCEVIVIVHWLMYLIYAWRGTHRYRFPEIPPLPADPPSVAVLIASCDEEPEVLSRSLSTINRLRYPRLKIYLIENSRKSSYKKQALALAEKNGVKVIDIPNRGHKAGALNDAMPLLDERPDLIAVIDADQAVLPEFLEETVPVLLSDPKLAFVQTSQLYENADQNWLVRAAAQQEMLLYDTIMEAKGSYRRTLCCGSNFVMRTAALEDVGGWDERSVSEDLMTSFMIHWKGWKSLYMRRRYSFGLGPPDLYSYWQQQKRWATGNTTVARIVLKSLLKQNPPLSPALAVDYIWSAGYYITAMALAGLATLPILLLILVRLGMGDIWLSQQEFRPLEWVYLSVYPLYAVIMLFPYVHMRLRGYPVRNLLMLQGLLSITIPVYVQSALRGILKKITFFEIAPKVFSKTRIKFWRAPQTYIFAGLMAAGGTILHLAVSYPAATFLWIILFWTFFYTVSFGHFFIFEFAGRLSPPMRETVPMPDAASEPLHVTETETTPCS